MLRPLLYLSALIALTETFSVNTEIQINSCILTYYQQSYSKIYANFTKDGFVFCFDGFFNNETSQDCIIGPKPRSNLAFFSRQSAQPTYESTIEQNVLTISNNMTCSIKFEILVEGYYVAFILSSFGSETALEFHSNTLNLMSCDVWVNGGVVERLFANSLETSVYTDISGCRIQGGGVKPGNITLFPTTCTVASCNMNRSITITGCGNQEHCDGNGVCLETHICTVTGPTIIDIHSTYNAVGDRCAYSLVSDSGFGILAEFRERQRKDVSFVNSVTLRFINTSPDIHLGQGGKVLVNNTLQTLNSTVQEVHGVELYKDQTGVHAKLRLSRRSLYVFFDGNTAQFHIEVPVGSSLDGLCGDSSSFSSAKLSTDSSSGCDILYTEPADSTINCTIMTQRCKILTVEPFSSCNPVLDPAPYITACSETLCRYPAGDSLRCQFLWAYARACSLKNATLGDWWLEAKCPPPEVFCQDKVCSDHEFCDIKNNGEPACLCRPIFASRYKESNTLGDPMICTKDSSSVSLVGCLLEEENIDYSLLHLNDETCKGVMDEMTHMVTFSYNHTNPCNTVITANDTQITYKNTIKAQSNTSGIIFRQQQFYIDFSCIILQPKVKTVAFRINDSSVVQHVTSGHWNYTVTMKAYTDSEQTQTVDSNTYVVLNQKIWMCVETKGLDANSTAVVTDFCWATNQKPFNSVPRYDLIQNGCANPADQTVKVEKNGVGTFCHFSFNMFKFTESSDEVYLHCKLNLCLKEGNNCVPGCPGGSRKRRYADPKYEPESSAFVSLAWVY